MELIMQPTCFTCGQACIAMIAGKSVDEVIKDMKTDGATSIGQLIEILDFYGIRHAEKIGHALWNDCFLQKYLFPIPLHI